MKNTFATTAIILAATLSAGSSFAAYSAPQNALNNVATSSYFAQSAPSVLSRAAVLSDLQAAQKAGTAPALGERDVVRDSSAPSTLTRAAVKAEAVQAQQGATVRLVDYRG